MSQVIPMKNWVRKYNFLFTEGNGRQLNGEWVIDRLVLKPEGNIHFEKSVKPISKYSFRTDYGNLSDSYMRTEFVVEVIDEKEVLGRTLDFNYAGGWAERFISNFSGAGRSTAGTCDLNPNVRELHRNLVLATMKPIKQLP